MVHSGPLARQCLKDRNLRLQKTSCPMRQVASNFFRLAVRRSSIDSRNGHMLGVVQDVIGALLKRVGRSGG